MTKKKFGEMRLIENHTERNVTYCRRKIGIIKKAIELSVICGQEIAVFIYDKEISKMVQYHSSKKFNLKHIDNLCNSAITENCHYESYNNEIYDDINN